MELMLRKIRGWTLAQPRTGFSFLRVLRVDRPTDGWRHRLRISSLVVDMCCSKYKDAFGGGLNTEKEREEPVKVGV